MALTYDSLLRRLQAMTPAQLATNVVVYDANNIDTRTIDDINIAGQEEDDDIRPGEGDVDDNQPYLIVGIC